MSFQGIYTLASQAMFAQDIRINVVAGNLVNAEVAAGGENEAYQARSAVLSPSRPIPPVGGTASATVFGVMVSEIVRSSKPADVRYQPEHPMADDNGQVFYPAIDTVEEMALMISAARSFETAVSLFTTGRHMQDRLVELVNL